MPDVCLYVGNKPKSNVKNIVFLKIGADITEGIILSEGNKGCLDPQQKISHVFDEERDYLYPIPTNERILNKALTQNPGWNDGVDNGN